jgi:ABC-type multidrug transport system fused ATPase/permease subunit
MEKFNYYFNTKKRIDSALQVQINKNSMGSILFNLIWYIGVGICFCMAYQMISVGVIAISTFIVFNSYIDQLKTPVANFVSFKQVCDGYDATFKNVFQMLDDEELKDIKEELEED